MATQFEGGSTGSVRKNLRLEKSPQSLPAGIVMLFRFTLQASAEVGAFRRAGGAGRHCGPAHLRHDRRCSTHVETDLGNVQCVRAADGWRASSRRHTTPSGGHEVNTYRERRDLTRSIVVLPKDFGTVDVEAGTGMHRMRQTPSSAMQSGGLYEAPAREKMWQGGLVNPVESLHHPCGLRSGQGGQTASRAAVPTPQSFTPSRRSLPRPRQRHGVVVLAAEPCPSPATPSSSTTAAGCAATSTGCRLFPSPPGRAWKRGRPWVCWARS